MESIKKLVTLKGYLFFFFIIFINCKNQEQERINREKIILEKCIESVAKKSATSRYGSYIINPYYGPFTFNNYVVSNYDTVASTLKNRDTVLKNTHITKVAFESLKKDMNRRFFNKRSAYLESFSKGRKSKRILTFSGISEKLVFLEIITYLDEINLDDYKDKPLHLDKSRIKDVTSLAFILDGNEISEVTVDGGLVYERW